MMWSRDGAVVRAIASHCCGPGLIPGLGITCGLSLLLVLTLAPRVFLQVLQFSSSFSTLQILIRCGNSGNCGCATDKLHVYLFIYLFYLHVFLM